MSLEVAEPATRLKEKEGSLGRGEREGWQGERDPLAAAQI